MFCHLGQQPAVSGCHGNNVTLETDLEEDGVDAQIEQPSLSSSQHRKPSVYFIPFTILLLYLSLQLIIFLPASVSRRERVRQLWNQESSLMFRCINSQLQHCVVLILLLCVFCRLSFLSFSIKFVPAVSIQAQMPPRTRAWGFAVLLIRCVSATTSRLPSAPITSNQPTGKKLVILHFRLCGPYVMYYLLFC